jgi:hypothetical protein
MRSMLRAFYSKPLALYLAAALFTLTSFAGPAEAMFISAATPGASLDASAATARTADLAKLQTSLESKLVRQKLMDYGLSPDETMARVSNLSDDQIHQLATHMDSLQAGGDAGSIVLTLLIIAMLGILLVFLVQGRVEIK